MYQQRTMTTLAGYLQPAHLKLSTRRQIRSINIHQKHFGDPDIGNPCCQLGDTYKDNKDSPTGEPVYWHSTEVVNQATQFLRVLIFGPKFRMSTFDYMKKSKSRKKMDMTSRSI
ncbi:hypothetical protein ACLKA6_013301 [Drosophila palustris]